MATLPDVTNLGARPVARGVGPVSVPQTIAPETLGRDITAASKILEDLQEDNDTIAAEDAYNHLIESRIEMTHGDNGYLNQKGENAVKYEGGLYPSYTKRFDDEVTRIQGTLKNENQINKFKKRSEIAGLQHKEGLIRHSSSQNEEYNQSVFKATIKTELLNITSNWADPEGTKISIGRLKTKIKSEGKRTGMDKESRDLLLKNTLDKAHTITIDQAIEAGDIDFAKEYYKKNGKHLIDKTGVWEKIIKGEVEVKAEDAVNQVMGMIESEQMDKEGALDHIRKMFGKTVRGRKIADEAARRLKIRYNEHNAITSRERSDADNEAFHIFADKGFSQIPESLKKKMNGSTLVSMKKAASAGATLKTDINKWDEFEALLDAGDIKSVDDIKKYDMYFSVADRGRARKAFEKSDDVKRGDIKAAYLIRKNEKWSDIAEDEDEAEAYRLFSDYITQRAKETRRPEDIEIWADRWFQAGRTQRDEWGDDPDFYYEAAIEGRIEEFSYDIPEHEEGALGEAMTMAGVDPTISRDYYNKFYIPAVDYLRAHGVDPNSKNIAAVTVLNNLGYPLTKRNIDWAIKYKIK